jgi:hypothetical protein
MTADHDTMARSAAADLHRRTDGVDTEAALAALHRSAGTGRHRVRRLVPSGRALAAAAAVVVLIAGVAFAVGTRGGGDGGTDRLGTETTQPVDPTSYGPLLGTLHGADAPELTGKVYGPAELQDGSKVAVSITGGRPGQVYLINQCATGTPDYNPAANCTGWGELQIGADGTAAGVFTAWAVFGAVSVPSTSECGRDMCSMEILRLVEEDQPDEGLPGTAFAPADGAAEDTQPSVPLTFAADVEVPPIPTMTATFIDRTAEGVHAHLTGRDFAPGQVDIVANGYLYPPTGMLAHLMSPAQEVVASVSIPASGRLSATVTLPEALTDLSRTTDENGVVQDPEIVACGVDTSTCDLWVMPKASAGEGTRGILTPLPTPYPVEPN